MEDPAALGALSQLSKHCPRVAGQHTFQSGWWPVGDDAYTELPMELVDEERPRVAAHPHGASLESAAGVVSSGIGVHTRGTREPECEACGDPESHESSHFATAVAERLRVSGATSVHRQGTRTARRSMSTNPVCPRLICSRHTQPPVAAPQQCCVPFAACALQSAELPLSVPDTLKFTPV